MGCGNSKPEVEKEIPSTTNGKDIARVREAPDIILSPLFGYEY